MAVISPLPSRNQGHFEGEWKRWFEARRSGSVYACVFDSDREIGVDRDLFSFCWVC